MSGTVYKGYEIKYNGWAWIGLRDGYDGPGDHINLKHGGTYAALKSEIDEQVEEEELADQEEEKEPEPEAPDDGEYYREYNPEDEAFFSDSITNKTTHSYG